MKTKKNEMILLAVVLGTAAFIWIGFKLYHSGPAVMAKITIDNKEVATLPLEKDAELTVRDDYGGENHIVVHDGGIECTKASCPDKICISQGLIKEAGSMIVCMPNKMVVYLFEGY